MPFVSKREETKAIVGLECLKFGSLALAGALTALDPGHHPIHPEVQHCQGTQN